MRIALDNNCPFITIEWLERAGHEVVYLAKEEPDEVWVDYAIQRGAVIYFSNDLDISNLLEKWDESATCIELPKNMNGLELARWITKRMKAIQDIIDEEAV